MMGGGCFAFFTKLCKFCGSDSGGLPKAVTAFNPTILKTADALAKLSAGVEGELLHETSGDVFSSAEDVITLVRNQFEELSKEKTTIAIHALENQLGAISREVVRAVTKAARQWKFHFDEPFLKASEKVRFRTPYMRAWGDGSSANTCEEAQAHWKAMKAKERHKGFLETNAEPVPVSGRVLLVWVVHELTTSKACPWTNTMRPEALLDFLQDEMAEADQEIRLLKLHHGSANRSEIEFLRAEDMVALISELGDMLFNLLMAIFLTHRDHGIDIVQAIASGNRLHCTTQTY